MDMTGPRQDLGGAVSSPSGPALKDGCGRVPRQDPLLWVSFLLWGLMEDAGQTPAHLYPVLGSTP